MSTQIQSAFDFDEPIVAQATIASQLPLSVGKTSVEAIKFSCENCYSEIPDEDLLGEVSYTEHDGGLSSQATCRTCGQVTTVTLTCDRWGQTTAWRNGEVMYYHPGRGLIGWGRRMRIYLHLLRIRLLESRQHFSFRSTPRTPVRLPTAVAIIGQSPQTLGSYGGTEIPEWLEFENMGRYSFYGVVRDFQAGVGEMEEGEIIVWPGLCYRRDRIEAPV